MSLHIPEIIMDLGPPHSLHYFTVCGAEIPFECNNFPQVLKEVMLSSSPNEDVDYTFPQTHWVLSALNTVPENRFICQQTLDKGDVINWPLKLMHPSRKNRVNQDFLVELYI